MLKPMVDVKFFGESCFLVAGRQTSLLFDPVSQEKKRSLTLEANVVLLTDKEKYQQVAGNLGKSGAGAPFVISGPGEYEISKATIVGLAAAGGKLDAGVERKITIYQTEVDGLTFGHLGNLGGKLTQSQLEVFGGVDVLMVPVGDKSGLRGKEAIEVVAQVEPKILIPMDFGQDSGQTSALDQFLSQIGKEKVSYLAKLSLSKDKFAEEMQVVVLSQA